MRINILVKTYTNYHFMRPLKQLVRANILAMKPCRSMRTELNGNEPYIWIERDENPYNSPYNRYPDASMAMLKAAVARVKNVGVSNIFVANGRHAVIDALYRCFCTPSTDNVVSVEPTYYIYNVLAELNGVENRRVLLDDGFRLSAEHIVERCDEHTKIIWICSPNTPVGNTANPEEVTMLLDMFDGIVVIDESYIDFSTQPSWRTKLAKYPNLVVVNTMDNSWGCAAISVAMLYASADIVDVLDKATSPFVINSLSQKVAIDLLRDTFEAEKRVRTIILERQRMMTAIRDLPICAKVYPSDTNFLLVEFSDAKTVYRYLLDRGIVVADCSDIPLCANCLRITIGSKPENNELLSALRQYK